MAVIAGLAVRLTLAAKNFLGGMGAAQKSAEKTGATFAGFVKKTAIIGTALSAVGAVVGHVIGQRFAASAKSINDLADRFDIGTEAIIGLQRAAKDLDLNESVVGTALDSLNKRLAQVEAGSLEAIDAFARLGVDGRKLAGLPLDRAFVTLSEAFHTTDSESRRAAAGVAIFADHAEAVLPLLALGKERLADAGMAARNMGESFSRIQGESLVQAAKALNDVKTAIEGLFRQVAVKIAPFIITVGKSIRDFIRSINVVAVVDAIANGIKAVIVGLAQAFLMLKIDVKETVVSILDGFKQLLDLLGRDTDALAKSITKMRRSIEVDQQSLRTVGGRIHAFFDALHKRVNTFLKGIVSAKTAGGALDDVARKMELLKKREGIFNETRTPLEKFQERIAELQFLLREGALDWNTFGRAASTALGELERANNMGEIKLADALQKGTKEAQSAITEFELKNRLNERRENAQDRIARAVEEGKRIQDRQLEVQRRIADLLRPRARVFGLEF